MLHNIWTKIVPNGMAFKTACVSKGQFFFFFGCISFGKREDCNKITNTRISIVPQARCTIMHKNLFILGIPDWKYEQLVNYAKAALYSAKIQKQKSHMAVV